METSNLSMFDPSTKQGSDAPKPEMSQGCACWMPCAGSWLNHWIHWLGCGECSTREVPKRTHVTWLQKDRNGMIITLVPFCPLIFITKWSDSSYSKSELKRWKGPFPGTFQSTSFGLSVLNPPWPFVLNGGNNGRRRLFIAAFAQLGKPLSGALCCVSLVALGQAQCGVVTLWIIMGYMWIYPILI